MNEQDAFVRAICENPGCDTVRLAYADWLDENGREERDVCPRCRGMGRVKPDGPYRGDPHQWNAGDPCPECDATGMKTSNPDAERAEFIRVQVELAAIGHLHPPADDEDRAILRRAKALRKRERELWGYLPARQGVLWETQAALPEGWAAVVGGDTVGLTDEYPWAIVRRGFVDEIRLPLAAFEEHARAIFGRHPVTKMVLTDVTPDMGLLRANAATHVYRHESHEDGNGSSLPSYLFDRLAGNTTFDTGGRYFRDSKGYETAVAASEAISRVLVDHGRSLAGLPPLAWPQAGRKERGVMSDEVMCRGCDGDGLVENPDERDGSGLSTCGHCQGRGTVPAGWRQFATRDGGVVAVTISDGHSGPDGKPGCQRTSVNVAWWRAGAGPWRRSSIRTMHRLMEAIQSAASVEEFVAAEATAT